MTHHDRIKKIQTTNYQLQTSTSQRKDEICASHRKLGRYSQASSGINAKAAPTSGRVFSRVQLTVCQSYLALSASKKLWRVPNSSLGIQYSDDSDGTHMTEVRWGDIKSESKNRGESESESEWASTATPARQFTRTENNTPDNNIATLSLLTCLSSFT